MPLFRCSTCGCVENTALGHYWTHDDAQIWSDEEVAKGPRCSEHGPKQYRDGTPTEFGEWHGKFSQKPAAGSGVDNRGFLWGLEEKSPFPIVGIMAADGTVQPIEKRTAANPTAAWPFPDADVKDR